MTYCSVSMLMLWRFWNGPEFCSAVVIVRLKFWNSSEPNEVKVLEVSRMTFFSVPQLWRILQNSFVCCTCFVETLKTPELCGFFFFSSPQFENLHGGCSGPL